MIVFDFALPNPLQVSSHSRATLHDNIVLLCLAWPKIRDREWTSCILPYLLPCLAGTGGAVCGRWYLHLPARSFQISLTVSYEASLW